MAPSAIAISSLLLAIEINMVYGSEQLQRGNQSCTLLARFAVVLKWRIIFMEQQQYIWIVHSADICICVYIEMTGAMDAEKILNASLHILRDKLNCMASKVDTLKDV
eukprot:15356059-Ditylum_brightwellii.AAC.3